MVWVTVDFGGRFAGNLQVQKALDDRPFDRQVLHVRRRVS